jgi:fibronectin type 3 domain-containing protein
LDKFSSPGARSGELNLQEKRKLVSAYEERMCSDLRKATLVLTAVMLIVGLGACFAAGEGELLFLDDFADPGKSLNAWTIVDCGGAPQWSYDGGVGSVKFGTTGYQFTWILAGERTWDNYQLDTKVKVVKGLMDVGLIVRSEADKSLYLIHVQQDSLTFWMMDKSGGWHNEGNVGHNVNFELGRWYEMAVKVKGTKLELIIDGVKIYEAYNSMYAKGNIGIYAQQEQDIPSEFQIDDVKVTALTEKVIGPGEWIDGTDPDIAKNNCYPWEGELAYWDNGEATVQVNIPHQGYYRLVVLGRGEPADGIWPRFEYRDSFFRGCDWDVTSGEYMVLVGQPFAFEPGVWELKLAFTNNDDGTGSGDRNMFVKWIALEEVLSPTTPPDPGFQVDGKSLDTYGPITSYKPAMIKLNVDGDFERDQVQWWDEHSGPGGHTVVWGDTSTAKFGSKSCSVTNTAADNKVVLYNWPAVNITTGDSYPTLIVSGWAKCDPGTTAKAKAEYRLWAGGDGSGAFLGSIHLEFKDLTTNWQPFEFIIRPEDFASGTRSILFSLVVYEGTGKIYFDGLSIYATELGRSAEQIPLSIEYIGDKYQLSWPAQANNMLYEIHRGTTRDFAFTDQSKIAVVTDLTTWIDESITTAELAYYKVRSIDNYFAARDSNEVVNSLYPPNAILNAPSLSDEFGGIILVSWDAPEANLEGERAAKYLVYRAETSTDLGKGDPIGTVNEDTTKTTFTWTDQTVIPGENYYYAIKCVGRAGFESALSKVAGPVEPKPDTVDPLPVESVEISTEIRGALKLTWQRPQAASDGDFPDEYHIYRSQKPDPKLEKATKIHELVAGAEASFAYLDVDVKPGVPYYYYLKSVDKAGNSVLGGEYLGTALKTGVPTLVAPEQAAAFVKTPVEFQWTLPELDYDDAVISFSLEYATEEDFSDGVLIPSITETEYTLPQDKIPVGVVWWRVRCNYRSGVVGSFSEPMSFSNVDAGNSAFPAPYLDFAPRLVRNNSTTLTFVLNEDGLVTLRIFDSKGKVVRVLKNKEPLTAKEGDNHLLHTEVWDTCDGQGRLLPDGLYIGMLTLERTGHRPLSITRKMQIFRAQ